MRMVRHPTSRWLRCVYNPLDNRRGRINSA